MEFMDNGTPVADWPEILERELIEFKSHEGAEISQNSTNC